MAPIIMSDEHARRSAATNGFASLKAAIWSKNRLELISPRPRYGADTRRAQGPYTQACPVWIDADQRALLQIRRRLAQSHDDLLAKPLRACILGANLHDTGLTGVSRGKPRSKFRLAREAGIAQEKTRGKEETNSLSQFVRSDFQAGQGPVGDP